MFMMYMSKSYLSIILLYIHFAFYSAYITMETWLKSDITKIEMRDTNWLRYFRTLRTANTLDFTCYAYKYFVIFTIPKSIELCMDQSSGNATIHNGIEKMNLNLLYSIHEHRNVTNLYNNKVFYNRNVRWMNIVTCMHYAY